MAYKPPYDVNKEMLEKVDLVMKYLDEISFVDYPILDLKLIKQNQIKSIHSSLVIEQNKLTEVQVTHLVNGIPVQGPEKDILEVKNAIEVYNKIKEIDPNKQEALLKYHKILMNELITDAGSFRKNSIGIYDSNKNVIFVAPPAERVPFLMNDLYDFINNSNENFLIKSCVFHYEFEFIHPFSDGNGRMGRLMQTCLLASKNEIFYYLPS